MKILKWSLIALVLLIAVLVFRAFTMESMQITAEPAPSGEFDAQQIAQKLGAGLRVKTISSRDPAAIDKQAFLEFQVLFAKQFPQLHSALKLEKVAETLLFRWVGKDATKPPILLMAHYDVVPVQKETLDRWSFQPFAGEIAEGYVRGRGALDNKGQLYMIAAAVEKMLARGFQPERDIWLAFGHDEEVGGANGNQAVAARFADQGIRFLAVLDEGGSVVQNIVPGIDGRVAMVGIAEKGYTTLRLSVEGVGGHSSMPPAETTVSVLAKAITDLQAKPFEYRITEPVEQFLNFTGPELPFVQRLAISNRWLLEPLLIAQMSKSQKTRAILHTTTAATMLSAGIQENVLAKRAEATVNFRVLPGETRQSVLQRVRDLIANDRVSVEQASSFSSDPSPVSSVESEAFLALQRSIAEVYSDAIVAPYLVVGGTDSRHYSGVADNVYRFAPFDLSGPKELDGMHGIDERISVSSLAAGAAFYQRIISRWSAL